MAQDRIHKQSDEFTRRRNRPDAVAPSAGAIAGQAFARAGFTDMTLVLRWEEIVGNDIARIARPIRMTAANGGGTLTLKCEPGAALFLQHETRSLVGRINGYLGRQAVGRIKCVQGTILSRFSPSIRANPTAELRTDDPSKRFLGPETLKSALINLAKARRRQF